MNPVRRVFIAGLLAVATSMLLADTAFAQQVLIRNAKVHTMSGEGTLEGADVLISGTRIVAVGRHLQAPTSARVVEAQGRPLTPGLFTGISGIGLEEVSQEDVTVDRNIKLAAPVYQLQWRPELDLAAAYNPRSVVVAVTRIEGFTWTMLGPGEGSDVIMQGQGAAVSLDGTFDATLPGSRTLYVQLGGEMLRHSGATRAAQYMLLDQAVAESRAPSRAPEAAPLLHPEGRAALTRYLHGGRVVFVVDRAADIHQVLAIAKRYGMKPVIAGGAEAWVVAAELARADVPVLLDPLQDLPETFDRIGARADNAALLDAAGVRIAFTQRGEMDTHNARKVRQRAGNAVAHGLPWEKGLAALTAYPAQIFGQDSTRGRIAAGYVADVVLWNGDPLEVTAMAEQVWIGGVAIPMQSRQTELRDRYAGSGQ